MDSFFSFALPAPCSSIDHSQRQTSLGRKTIIKVACYIKPNGYFYKQNSNTLTGDRGPLIRHLLSFRGESITFVSFVRYIFGPFPASRKLLKPASPCISLNCATNSFIILSQSSTSLPMLSYCISSSPLPSVVAEVMRLIVNLRSLIINPPLDYE